MTAGTEDWQQLLAEDVHLVGPLADVTGKAAFIGVNVPFFAALQRYETETVVVQGDRVLTRANSTVVTPKGAHYYPGRVRVVHL